MRPRGWWATRTRPRSSRSSSRCCGCRAAHAGRLDAALPTLSGVEAVAAMPLDGVADDRASVERTRAFVKVQDGCSFFCTYCIIPRARGAERSLAPDVVLADVRRALAAGHREIVLTGINIGTYDGGWSERGARGSHVRSALTLAGPGAPDPRRDARRADPPQLDRAPARRRRAARGVGRRRAADAPAPPPAAPGGRRRRAPADGPPVPDRRLRRASSSGPGPRSRASRSMRTSSPASRPRTTLAHARSLAFIAGLEPAGLHVFRYSARPGTPATRMAGQVDERTKKARAADLLVLGAEAKARSRVGSIGTTTRVLLEQRLPDGRWVGHAEDHVLVAVAPRAGDPGDLENALVTRAPDGGRPRRTPTASSGSRSTSTRRRVRFAGRSPSSPAQRPEVSMPADCLFCRIVAGEIPATRLHEDDLVIAIRDINPQAPTHVLVLPVPPRRVRRGPRRRRRPAARAAVRRRGVARRTRGARQRLATRDQRRVGRRAERRPPAPAPPRRPRRWPGRPDDDQPAGALGGRRLAAAPVARRRGSRWSRSARSCSARC